MQKNSNKPRVVLLVQHTSERSFLTLGRVEDHAYYRVLANRPEVTHVTVRDSNGTKFHVRRRPGFQVGQHRFTE